MKTIGKLITLIFTLLVLAASAYAQTPRDELKQMVEQLQKTPNDNALREKTIKLATEIKPAPAIPEEAERHMAYGTAAFTGAKSVADYKEAAKEFKQATLAAPWYGDAYFNLGVAQDKAENYEAALRSLKLAQLASPEVKEIKALIYEVEYRKEANAPEAAAARQREKDEALIKSLDGAVFVGPKPHPWEGSRDFDLTTIYELRIHGNQVSLYGRVVEQGRSRWTPGTIFPPTSVNLTGKHFTINGAGLDISPDGLSVSSDFGNSNMTFRKR